MIPTHLLCLTLVSLSASHATACIVSPSCAHVSAKKRSVWIKWYKYASMERLIKILAKRRQIILIIVFRDPVRASLYDLIYYLRIIAYIILNKEYEQLGGLTLIKAVAEGKFACCICLTGQHPLDRENFIFIIQGPPNRPVIRLPHNNGMTEKQSRISKDYAINTLGGQCLKTYISPLRDNSTRVETELQLAMDLLPLGNRLHRWVGIGDNYVKPKPDDKDWSSFLHLPNPTIRAGIAIVDNEVLMLQTALNRCPNAQCIYLMSDDNHRTNQRGKPATHGKALLAHSIQAAPYTESGKRKAL